MSIFFCKWDSSNVCNFILWVRVTMAFWKCDDKLPIELDVVKGD